MKYIFDVDGTLTPPRNKILEEFSLFLQDFFKLNECYLASGSDFSKIKSQVGNLTRFAKGVFGCSGNEYYENDFLVHKQDWEIPLELELILESFIKRSKYPKRYGNHIEKRTGAVNFSICGRNATNKERKDYFEWDKKQGERQKITSLLQGVFTELNFDIGGEISIDIYPIGCDKSQIAQKITSPVTFFGDKIIQGGNDWTLAEVLLKRGDQAIMVNSWIDTLSILKEKYDNQL